MRLLIESQTEDLRQFVENLSRPGIRCGSAMKLLFLSNYASKLMLSAEKVKFSEFLQIRERSERQQLRLFRWASRILDGANACRLCRMRGLLIESQCQWCFRLPIIVPTSKKNYEEKLFTQFHSSYRVYDDTDGQEVRLSPLIGYQW